MSMSPRKGRPPKSKNKSPHHRSFLDSSASVLPKKVAELPQQRKSFGGFKLSPKLFNAKKSPAAKKSSVEVVEKNKVDSVAASTKNAGTIAKQVNLQAFFEKVIIVIDKICTKTIKQDAY